MSTNVKSGSRMALILSWLLVGVPAAWGVEQTVYKSLALFKAPVAAATLPSTAPFGR